MEIELIERDVQILFAQYLFCQVSFDGKSWLLSEINSKTLTLKRGKDKVVVYPLQAKLLLKTMSSLTHDECLLIANMLVQGEQWFVTERLDNYIEMVSEKYSLDICTGQFKIELKWLEDGEMQNISIELIDVINLLREWGYMIPYKGIDLFDCGIAIQKTI